MTKSRSVGLLFIILFFSLLIIILNINNFIFLKNSNYSDIAITHYPNLLFIQKSIGKYAQIPFWSNLIQSGYPFAANPLSGIWYLFGWIAIMFPLPAGININLILHVSLAFIGLFNFLRENDRSFQAAIFGAMIFAFSTKFFAHIGAGHLTLVYSVCWTPWLLYFTKKYYQSPFWFKKLTPGIIFGLIITSDPRWVLPAGILWLSYVIKEIKEPRKILSTSLISVTTGLITSAGLWIPLIQYIPLSTRSALTIQDKLIYSLDFQKLIGLFIPEFGGFAEWILYPGALVILLFVLGLFISKENKKIRYWYFVAFISIILSLGINFPLVSIIFSLPFFSLLRVPSRFLLVFILAVSMIAPFVMDYLIIHEKKYNFDRIFFISPILFFIIFISIGVIVVTGQFGANLIWACLFFIASFVAIAIVYHLKRNRSIFYLFFIGLLFIDLIGINLQSLEFRSPSDLLNLSPEMKNILLDLPDFARIYTPSYSITQEQAAFWGINQVNGIDPMQLSNYVTYFSQASGIPVNEYTVTLPPFKNGDPINANESFCPENNLMAELNVKYLISDFQLPHCKDIGNFQKVDNLFIYIINENPSIAHFEDGNKEIKLMEYSPNRISLSTNNGGKLILSEIYYPGWTAKVDGEEVKIESSGIFRSVYLSERPHYVEFIFKPVAVLTGGFVQIISMLLFLILVVRKY